MCIRDSTPSIYTIFDNNLKGKFIFLHHFNSKGTVPFTSAAEAAMTASNLPGDVYKSQTLSLIPNNFYIYTPQDVYMYHFYNIP